MTGEGRALAATDVRFRATGPLTTARRRHAAAALLNVPYMNTMYADRDGNILYIYNSAVPRRSTAYDWRSPVDGSDPGTEWDGYHTLDELPEAIRRLPAMLRRRRPEPLAQR